MLKNVIYAIATSVVVITSMFFLHTALFSYFSMEHRSVNFGITIHYTGILFCISILILNIYLKFTTKYKYTVAFILIASVSYLPSQSFNVRPFRSLMLILFAILGVVASMIIQNYYRGKN